MLAKRKKAAVRLRHFNAQMSHASHYVQILQRVERLANVWIKRRSEISVGRLKKIRELKKNLELYFKEAAIVLAQHVQMASAGSYERSVAISEDLERHKNALERHDRLYGSSAPRGREAHEESLKEVAAALHTCAKGLNKISEVVREFHERCLLRVNLTMPPSVIKQYGDTFARARAALEIALQKTKGKSPDELSATYLDIVKTVRAIATTAKQCTAVAPAPPKAPENRPVVARRELSRESAEAPKRKGSVAPRNLPRRRPVKEGAGLDEKKSDDGDGCVIM